MENSQKLRFVGPEQYHNRYGVCLASGESQVQYQAFMSTEPRVTPTTTKTTTKQKHL